MDRLEPRISWASGFVSFSMPTSSAAQAQVAYLIETSSRLYGTSQPRVRRCFNEQFTNPLAGPFDNWRAPLIPGGFMDTSRAPVSVEISPRAPRAPARGSLRRARFLLKNGHGRDEYLGRTPRTNTVVRTQRGERRAAVTLLPGITNFVAPHNAATGRCCCGQCPGRPSWQLPDSASTRAACADQKSSFLSSIPREFPHLPPSLAM